MLEKRVPKFRTANTNRREKMVRNAADHIERTWAEDIEFDRDAVTSVCELSAKLCSPHAFLAYLRVSVRQNETGIEEVRV